MASKSKRIVFDGGEKVCRDLDAASDCLELSKVETIRVAVHLLYELSQEVAKGSKLMLQRSNSAEVEIWLPQLQSLKK